MNRNGDAEAAVVPGVPGQGGPIVLATDFGAVSSAAERVAIQLAFDAGVPLVIVHAIDPGRLRLPGGRFLQRIDQARAARDLDTRAIARRVVARGVTPQILVWEGDPSTCVLEAARAEGASRIVVGSHGRGRLGRTLIGSVSASIAEGADRPVDVVRVGGDDEGLSSVQGHPAPEHPGRATPERVHLPPVASGVQGQQSGCPQTTHDEKRIGS
jgi:nucleotide-binding universal stress UspA family protein